MSTIHHSNMNFPKRSQAACEANTPVGYFYSYEQEVGYCYYTEPSACAEDVRKLEAGNPYP
eukprot:gene3174-13869_t